MKRIISLALVLLGIFCIFGCEMNSKSNNIILDVAKTLRKNYGSGDNVRIAIIDSGLATVNYDEEYMLDFSEENVTTDFLDHGTPIWNILADKEYGLAPNATIYSLKVINKYGNASTQGITNALEWCLDNSIDIINMSLSFGVHNENIECLINELIQSGVIIVASINNVTKELDYPSMYNGVICVGVTDTPKAYNETYSIVFTNKYNITAVGIDGKLKDYVGNSFLAPIITGTIACLIDKTSEERRGTSEELVETVKYVLAVSNINIM